MEERFQRSKSTKETPSVMDVRLVNLFHARKRKPSSRLCFGEGRVLLLNFPPFPEPTQASGSLRQTDIHR
uniref:Uncharacterized protein n=1 Tax=Picea glauca TaxID=3330 RepID=A0A101M5K6_PICGL|nr:hypothetical protein ABT39_MTgene1149 [Picea glauca]QHR91106.1 hypothetical protein Q903MT_gene5138 [Picea sitchensis]